METSVLQNITQSYSYEEYKKMVIKYADEYTTSGEHLEERSAATLINAQRMKRIDKQCIIN